MKHPAATALAIPRIVPIVSKINSPRGGGF